MINLYLYEGPVTSFGKPIMQKYKAYTHAASDKQAKNNIKSRWKKEHGFLQTYKIELPGEVQEVLPRGE